MRSKRVQCTQATSAALFFFPLYYALKLCHPAKNGRALTINEITIEGKLRATETLNYEN